MHILIATPGDAGDQTLSGHIKAWTDNSVVNVGSNTAQADSTERDLTVVMLRRAPVRAVCESLVRDSSLDHTKSIDADLARERLVQYLERQTALRKWYDSVEGPKHLFWHEDYTYTEMMKVLGLPVLGDFVERSFDPRTIPNYSELLNTIGQGLEDAIAEAVL
jgi:hypothetical protein